MSSYGLQYQHCGEIVYENRGGVGWLVIPSLITVFGEYCKISTQEATRKKIIYRTNTGRSGTHLIINCHLEHL